MTRTNFEKLTSFDADFYAALTDNDCIVCLTERQVYILGQTLEQITWLRTRWVGNTTGLDVDEISSEIQYRLAERMTCETLTTILVTIEGMQVQIQSILSEIAEDNIAPEFDVDTTTVSNVYSESELTDLGVTAATCDNAGKDAIYGAVKQLVSYITQNNTDFLEEIEQHVGNTAELASTLTAAFPPTNLLAIDDLADQLQFLVEELLEEYNATVDEELIQTTICDLFCIAVDNDCHIDFNLIFDYFGSFLPSTPSQAITTWANVMQFAVIGNFSGNQYFYYLCWLQLFAALTGNGLYGTVTINSYALQLRAGLNTPDADWSIFCIDCPPPNHPIISAVDCVAWGAAVGTLVHQHGNVWRITSALGTGTQRVMLQRAGGGKFRLTSTTLIEGVRMPPYRLAKIFGGSCTTSTDGSPNPALNDLVQYGFSEQDNSAFVLEIAFVDID